MERPPDLRDLIPKRGPRPLPQGVKDVKVSLKDGSLLARIYLSVDSGPSLFFFHAEGESIDYYDTLGHDLNLLGISLIVIGYRGRSSSTEGEPSFKTIFQDALEAFDYLKLFLEKRGRVSIIALLGRSLGTAVALKVAVERITSVSALILDSPIVDSQRWLAYYKLSYKEFPFSPIECIKKWYKPLLVFQAQFDKIFSLPEAEKFLVFCPGKNKRLLIMPGYKREETIERGGKLYAETIAELLNRMVGRFGRKSLHQEVI